MYFLTALIKPWPKSFIERRLHLGIQFQRGESPSPSQQGSLKVSTRHGSSSSWKHLPETAIRKWRRQAVGGDFNHKATPRPVICFLQQGHTSKALQIATSIEDYILKYLRIRGTSQLPQGVTLHVALILPACTHEWSHKSQSCSSVSPNSVSLRTRICIMRFS